MEHSCSDYRIRVLDRVVADDAAQLTRTPLPACAVCERWTQRVEGQLSGLRSIGRVSAPDELRERLVQDRGAETGGEFEDTRLTTALADLPALSAPSELRARVELELAPQSLRAVSSLTRHRAPAVLKRLVVEELSDSAGQRTRRFVGDLEPQAAPASLWQRAVRSNSSSTLRIWRPVAGLAAAALLIWVIAKPTTPEQERWSFAVVHVSDPASLDPMAHALAGGLTGGAASIFTMPGGVQREAVGR